MLAYSLKHILELVPEAYEHVKQASLDQDLPLDSASSVIASALDLKYHEYVDQKPIDVFAIEKVARAVDAYGVRETVSTLSDQLKEAALLDKIASRIDLKAEFHTKQAMFAGDLSGFKDLLDSADVAEDLYKEAQALQETPSEEVLRYSAHGWLSKQAAVEALAARYQASGDTGFAKIAVALGRMPTESLKYETVRDICRTVAEMDKSAGLNIKGFDFYREALITKEAALASVLAVTLDGKSVPYESIERVGRSRIAQYVGEDVAKEMDQGPAHAKQVFETLPLDLQKLVVSLTQNV